MDIFGRFARSPDCLVAIDAADGGTWHSPFRPGVVYPSVPSGGGSFEERTGLIAKKNIKTSNGYFESAIASGLNNPANRWWVQTAVNIKGRPIHGSYIFRAYMATLPPAPTTYLRTSLCTTARGLFSLVQSTDNAGTMTFNGLLGAKTTTGGQGSLSFPPLTRAQISPYLDKWTVFVLNVNYSTRNLSFYADGVLIASTPINPVYMNYFYDLAGDDFIGAGGGTGQVNQGDYTKVKNFLVFNRPLRLDEIQLLR